MSPSIASAAGLLGADSFSGVLVAGGAAGGGEASWVKGGEGKLQTGGDQTEISGIAIVAWRGNLSSRIGAVVTADLQSQAIHPVGLDEAYLTLRPDPESGLRVSGRAGLFFPPASLEHDGTEWSVVRTLTPSAVDSWIAEEVKVLGVEATVRGAIAHRSVGLTVSAFQGDDTSGALLAFRGWALHDLRSNLGGEFRLPPLSAPFAGKQSELTQSIDELDGRWGFYGRLDYAPTDNLSLNLFVYDNGGDRTTVKDGQYAWRTRFAEIGARWTPGPKTEVMAQIVRGETAMGVVMGGQRPVDVGFSAAYVLLSRVTSRGTATLRLDQFSVEDRSFKIVDNNAERGWAVTAAWSLPVSAQAEVVTESVLAESHRADRARLGERPSQSDFQTRVAYRLSF